MKEAIKETWNRTQAVAHRVKFKRVLLIATKKEDTQAQKRAMMVCLGSEKIYTMLNQQIMPMHADDVN